MDGLDLEPGVITHFLVPFTMGSCKIRLMLWRKLSDKLFKILYQTNIITSSSLGIIKVCKLKCISLFNI